MDRAIKIRGREPDSSLSKYDLSHYFKTPLDSKTVALIWECAIDGRGLEGPVLEILDKVGKTTFIELQWIATLIMERAISAIANSGVATFIHMGPTNSNRGHIVFFEGGITKNRCVLPRVKAEMLRLVREKRFYENLGVSQPKEPIMEPDLLEVLKGKHATPSLIQDVDFSLIGAATSVIAESCIRKQN